MNLSSNEKARLKRNFGTWAVISGSTSGIGLALSNQLASAGFKLVIISRGAEQLEICKQALNSTYKTEVITVQCDIADESAFDHIVQITQGLEIGMLVLSAGFGTSGFLSESSLENERKMIRVNCEAVLALVHYYSKQFIAQKRGGIIMMSSIVAFQGNPFAANYAASKAYVQSLAEGLAIELKPFGIAVLAAAPGPVKSGFAKRANMRMTITMKPERVANDILIALGRKTTVYPGLLTKVLVYSLKLLPRWAKVHVMGAVMKGMTEHKD